MDRQRLLWGQKIANSFSVTASKGIYGLTMKLRAWTVSNLTATQRLDRALHGLIRFSPMKTFFFLLELM